MKTLLYTGYDDAYRELAGITVPRMAQYADRHGMDINVYTEPLIDVPNGIYWTGVVGALRAFEVGYERVIYLDVDQLITNFDVELPGTHGFHASKDWGTDAVEPHQFSMCGFVAHRDCQAMFGDVLAMEFEWRDKPFPEQGPMQYVVKALMETVAAAKAALGDQMRYNLTTLDGLINIHPRKVFNCVPDLVAPGNVPEPWAPGDFAAHLTMVPIERRIEIAQEILATL